MSESLAELVARLRATIATTEEARQHLCDDFPVGAEFRAAWRGGRALLADAVPALLNEIEVAYVRGLRESLMMQREEQDFANRPPLGPWTREEIEHVRAAALAEQDPILQRALRLFLLRTPSAADVQWAEEVLERRRQAEGA